MIQRSNAGTATDPDTSLNLLAEAIRSCRECPLFKKGRACPGVGVSSAQIMVVGQAPGIDESKLGQPFIGQAGRFLGECLESVGLKDSLIFYTNLVRHFPGREGSGDACPPYAIQACRHWLEDEYRLVQPKLIVAVGAISARFFGMKGGINQGAGFVFHSEEWGVVLPILHPAYILRPQGFTKAPQFITQLNAIRVFLEGGACIPPYHQA